MAQLILNGAGHAAGLLEPFAPRLLRSLVAPPPTLGAASMSFLFPFLPLGYMVLSSRIPSDPVCILANALLLLLPMPMPCVLHPHPKKTKRNNEEGCARARVCSIRWRRNRLSATCAARVAECKMKPTMHAPYSYFGIFY